jgi:hypothetical protein
VWTEYPPVARVLATLERRAPRAVTRARPVLEQLLRRAVPAPESAGSWALSHLNSSGFPLEFTFVAGENGVRYTAELDVPGWQPARRLEQAVACLEEREAAVPRALRIRLAAAQQGGPLKFGAWIGGRHDESGDRAKLYAEVASDSPAAQALVAEQLGDEALLVDRRYELRMVGYEPATARLELYFRGFHLQPYHLRLLLARAGMDGEQEQLLEAIASCFPYQSRRVPGDEWALRKAGFSYSLGGESRAPVFSFFLPARKLFGSDASSRQGLLALAERYGWELGAYQEVSAPLAEATHTFHHHGIVSFLVAGAHHSLYAGLAPPPLQP